MSSAKTPKPPKRLPRRLEALNISQLSEISYCIYCIDSRTGERGHFAYDDDRYLQMHEHLAISPIFKHLDEFYAWARAEGFPYHKLKAMFVLCRDFE